MKTKKMTISEIKEMNQKVATLMGFEGTWNANNFCEDMNSATQLLNQFAEIENVAIQKDEGKWDISADCWQVSHEELPMAICLGFIKWKERGTKKHENKP